jgi:hypothetical protein
VFAKKVKFASPTYPGPVDFLAAQLSDGAAIDELRISNTARYTMNYSTTKAHWRFVEQALELWNRLRNKWH